MTITIDGSNGITLPGTSAPIKGPTQTILTTPGSGTYTTPANVTWIRVRMVGGGGGGGGGGTDGNVNTYNGGNGANTVFGTSLLFAAGGSGGQGTWDGTGIGGSASISSPATGIAFKGADGAVCQPVVGYSSGGSGGSSPFGGAASRGNTGTTNSGSGGGGGGCTTSSTSSRGGVGGGAGGYVEAIIN